MTSSLFIARKRRRESSASTTPPGASPTREKTYALVRVVRPATPTPEDARERPASPAPDDDADDTDEADEDARDIPTMTKLSNVSDTTIGTYRSNTLTIPCRDGDSTRFVSREHAIITPKEGPDGGHVLVDLGSLNGTFVNDQVVSPGRARLLRHGDVLWLGCKLSWIDGKKVHNDCVFTYELRDEGADFVVRASSVTCGVCFEMFGDNQGRSVVPCGHTFCLPCVRHMTSACIFSTCPTCRTPVSPPGTIPFRCEAFVSRALTAVARAKGAKRPRTVSLAAASADASVDETSDASGDAPLISREKLGELIRRMKKREETRLGKKWFSLKLVRD